MRYYSTSITLFLIQYIHFDNHLARVNKLESAQMSLEERNLVVIPVNDRIKNITHNQ
ncbi:MAG: hypothetical protein U5K51_16305 [Flavobacteriaceae bacterium]|nr:hypothetical protein [Flavobacteriaceae bacterium]